MIASKAARCVMAAPGKMLVCDEYKVSLSSALRNLVADGGYAYRIRPE
jgi:hypothetical protein